MRSAADLDTDLDTARLRVGPETWPYLPCPSQRGGHDDAA